MTCLFEMKNRSICARSAAPVLSILSLTLAAGVQAQGIDLNPVVVSAARIEQKLSDVIPSASVITREEIERSQAPTLVDLLQGQAGVEIGRNGGPGTVSSLFMRGQNSNSVAVFVDGVRVQTDQTGGLKFIDIPPNQIEKIEILRGNAGAIYGEAATGGVINIFTRVGSGGAGAFAYASYGSRSTSDLSVGYSVKTDDLRWGVSAQKFESDSFSALNTTQQTNANPDPDGLKRESIFLYADKRLNKDLSVGLQANQIHGKSNYDNAFDGSKATHNNKTENSNAVVSGQLNVNANWVTRLALAESIFQATEFKNGVINGTVTEGKQQSVQWGNTYRWGSHNATFGVDSVDADYTSGATYHRKSIGSHAGLKGRFDRFDYQTHVRHDRIQAQSASAHVSQSADTWLIGSAYQLTEALKLTGLLSTSFRAPNTGELFNTQFTTGNPNLKPEQHKGHELGFNYATPIGLLRWVRFESKTTNAIAFKSGTPSYENIGLVENKGHEAGFSGMSSGWVYKLSAIHQDPINALTGARLARRARQYGSLDLGKTWMGIDWGTQIVASGQRVDGTKSLDSYTLLHFLLSKKITPDWTARFKIENAFDKKYQLAYGYNTPPRGVFASLQYQAK